MTASRRTERAARAVAAVRRRGADVDGRLRQVVAAAGPTGGHAEAADPLEAVLEMLATSGRSVTWLVLAVVSGRLPDTEDLVQARRAAQLDGPGEVLVHAAGMVTDASAARRVTVLTDTTLVDLGDLVSSPLGTGIQRVARNVTVEWVASRKVRIAAWTEGFDAMRLVSDDERDRVLDGVWRPDPDADPAPPVRDVVVPWRSTYLLPELAVDPTRCAAMQAMATYSENRTGVIGFDCVPITSSETSALGFAGVFALNLGAVAHFDAVAAISEAAAREYTGWRRMLAGAGLPGPEVHAVGLPTHAPEPSSEALEEARARLCVPGMPMVLCVGSHEPRKNHLAVLHAAEMLWRQGHRFTVAFVGGHSWGSEDFEVRLAQLQGGGRPVESISRLPDRLLWAAYRLARFTVFPSVNEGFGLPVAESLAAGTPAVTSDFGSMREIAEAGGALLVDPRTDADLATAMECLLTDDAELERLRAEADARPRETWRDYADRVWAALNG